jgi:Domain of unknown function (DUF6542)
LHTVELMSYAAEFVGPPEHADPATLAEPAEPAGRAGPTEPAGSPAAPQRPPGTRRVSSRGVTARGVVVLILATTLLAGLAGRVIVGHRTGLFGLVFALSSAVGALVVRRRDLPAAMVAPPLLYCVLIVAMSLVDRGGLAGGLTSQIGVYVGTAFVTGAPAIWSGSLLAAGIGWYRLRTRG